jgi:hypothetical protein
VSKTLLIVPTSRTCRLRAHAMPLGRSSGDG